MEANYYAVSLVEQLIHKYGLEIKMLRNDTFTSLSEGVANDRIANKLDEVIEDLNKIKSELQLI